MGEYFKQLQDKIKHNWKSAFISSFIVGMIAHLYKFTNTLPNHDALYNVYSDQNVLASRRWFLSIACGIGSYFDLPFINGLLSLLWIALTAVVIVDIFDVKSRFAAVLIGGLLVSFPCVTNTFFYEYTADGYMLAMLLATMTVKLTLFDNRKVRNNVLAAVCICLCCGIYQAYVSFAIMLSLCYFIVELLKKEYNKIEYFKWIFKQLSIYGLGMILFWLVWKLSLRTQNTVATAYQGINRMCLPNVETIIVKSKECIYNLARFFIGGDISKYGLNLYALINLIFIAIAAITIIRSVEKSGVGTPAGGGI